MSTSNINSLDVTVKKFEINDGEFSNANYYDGSG
jgi:hypothetical protein